MKVPWADGKDQSTFSYRIFQASWAKRLSWKETATIFGSSWDTVFRAVDWVVRWGLVHREIGDIKAIGVDEIAYRRGHKYLTLVYQIDADCRRLLKRRENLTDQQTVKLSELLQCNLRSIKAYLMREDFQRFWEYKSATWAGRFSDQWCRRAMRSKIEPMKEMARTLRTPKNSSGRW